MRLIKAILCQFLAFCLARLIAGYLFTIQPHLFVLLAIQGISAACFARIWRQERWWQLFHLALPLAAGLMLSLTIPPAFYLGGFVLLMLIFWGTAWGDVPLFLSSPAVIDALTVILERERPPRFAELGAGIGTVVVPIAQRFPDMQIHAIERAPLPWICLRWRCRNLGNVKVIRADFWQIDLKPYSVIYAFLSPLVMTRLGQHVARDMPTGGLLLSAAFEVPNWIAETEMALNSTPQNHLFCYRMPQNGSLRKPKT